MRAIDVFGMLPGGRSTLGAKNDPPNLPKHGVPQWQNGVWLFTDNRGVKTVMSKQGTVDANGNWSGCQQSIGYDAWVQGGRLDPCTGQPIVPEAPAAAPVAAPSSPGRQGYPSSAAPAPAPAASTVHPAVIAGGVGAAGFIALVATGVVKL